MEGQNDPHVTPERERTAEREQDRLNRLQMTSPSRRNRRRPQPTLPAQPIPQPNFGPPPLAMQGFGIPPMLNQPMPFAGHPVAWQYPYFVPHPLPMNQYPGLPRNAVEHILHNNHGVDRAAQVVEQTQIMHMQRVQRRRQGRGQLRQQVQAEVMALQPAAPPPPAPPPSPVPPSPPLLQPALPAPAPPPGPHGAD
ncbi:hypothetical protein EDD15DRAFT_2200703, partial [Pisolithus albus]